MNPNNYLRYWQLSVRKNKWPINDKLTFYLHGDFNFILTTLQYIGTKDIYTDFHIEEIDEEIYVKNKDNEDKYEKNDEELTELFSKRI